MSHIQKLLNILIRVGALKHGEFRDNLVTLDPEGLKLLSLAFLYHVRRVISIKAIGGPIPGADYLVRAISHQSDNDGESSISAFTVCKERIEGRLEKGIPVAVVNNTYVTGVFPLEMISVVEDFGCKVVLVVVVLDGYEGGDEELRKKYNFQALLRVTPEGVIVPTE